MSNPLIARFAGEPALVSETASERVQTCLDAVASYEHMDAMLEHASNGAEDFWGSEDRWLARLRPYVVQDGILQIPVKGVLLNNFPYQLYDWATGYEYIWEAFKRGCADFAVGTIKGIALVEDTPGGMVAGCFDAVDRMIALKEKVGVPVRAFAHESAYSAGYAIATVADHIVVSRTGGVGSIGVVTSHTDVSGAMEQRGVKVTFIASDPSKVEGNPYEPLSDDAQARIQARIDELYGIFVAAVSRSRGLSEDAIRKDLKAHCFTATQAVSNGLADSIGSPEDAHAAYAASLDEPSDNNGDDEMTTPVETVEKAVHEQAVADAHAAGAAEGAASMQTRIGAILGSEEAKGRETLAQHFAFKSDMAAEDAVAALAAAPAAPAATESEPAPTFADAMKQGNPNVGVEAEKTDDKADKQDGSDVLALVRAAGIGGFAPAQK